MMNRYKSVKKASIIGMIANSFLFVFKIIIGLFSNSQAMIADAINSAGDVVSSIMTFIGNKIASKPQDSDHNLGHGKAEYIYSMLISIVILYVGAILLKDSISSLILNETYHFSIFLIIVCLITIITKLCLYFYTKKIALKFNNLLMEANSKDHRNDFVMTTLNLVAVCLAYNNIYFIDGIVGIIISIWIMIGALKIFKDSYDVLMDKTLSNENKEKILKIISNYKEVKKINHFNATPVGYQYQISFTIFVDGNLSTFASHEIANNIERELEKLDEIYLSVIHVNPI